ncbi:MAG: hypothetical protein EAX86_01555 [Candidatus Heimdallarchaeota archaeon]|nr:hypothetical protein [Candidatus Heimdallarchaeota archaeon]
METENSGTKDEMGFFNELGRKAVHLSVFIIPIAYHWLQIELWFIQLALFLVICIWFLPMEFYRLKINPNTWVNYITRDTEHEGPANYILTSFIWLMILLGVNFSLYSMEIAELALVATVIGDSLAALIGKGMGKINLPLTEKKTIEGFVAGLVGTYLVGLFFLFAINYPYPSEIIFLPILPTIAWGIFDFSEDLPWYFADNIFHPTITLILSFILKILNIIS